MLRQFMRSWLAPGAGLSLAIAWAFGPGLIACTRNAGDDDANDESSGQIPHDDPEASGESGALEGADDTPPWDLDDPDAGTLARGIELIGLEINQGVAIEVARAGETLDAEQRRAPLVSHRGALVRAIHRVASDWSPRELEGRLTLYHEDGRVDILRDELKVEADADFTRDAGAFTWALEAGQVTTNLAYSVGVYDREGDASVDLDRPPRIPSAGQDQLDVPDLSMRLEIVLVPVAVADLAPDFTPDNLESVHAAIYELNPVDEVVLRVRDPIDLETATLPDCLSAITAVRGDDGPANHVYYIGLMNGTPSGLSNVVGATPQAAAWRTSCAMMGTPTQGWAGLKSQIVAHELGHAQGSRHNPGCRADGVTDDYPHLSVSGRSEIGYEGYGVLSGERYAASIYYDVMSYCRPHWVSDYSYKKWARTISILSSWPQAPVQRANSDAQGMLLWGLEGTGETLWWITSGEIDPALVAADGQLEWVDERGRRVQLPMFAYELSEGKGVVAALPASWRAAPTQDEIIVRAFGRAPERMTRDQLVRARYSDRRK